MTESNYQLSIAVLAAMFLLFLVLWVIEARMRHRAERELERLEGEIKDADGLVVRYGANLYRFDAGDVSGHWFYRSTLEDGSAVGVSDLALGSHSVLKKSYLELDGPIRVIGRDARLVGNVIEPNLEGSA